jgi:aminoglycoside phosphotransferase (APT) family kinase protein
MTDAQTRVEELERFLSAQTGCPVHIENARPLAGGASMESWALDADVAGERLALVLRRDMGSNMYEGALTRAQEFALLRAAHAHGVLAPRPRWLSEGPGRAFFLMDRLPGESVGRRVVRAKELASARAKLAAQMGTQLAKIHAVPLDDSLPSLARPAPGETAAQAGLAVLRKAIDTLGPRPVWEYCHRWLARNAPAPSGPLTLVHGDFRIGNLLVAPDAGLTGVLDWEFAHVGDPLEDLSWPLVRDWRFENDALPVGGVGALDDYLGAYRAAGGRAVDARALAWWELLGNLRWAVFCHAQAQRHLSGQDRSVELASLGRKAYEVEWELLDRIGREEEQR